MSGKKKGNIANPDLHSSESPAKDGNELKNRINETAKYSELFEKIDVDSDYDDILATYEKTLDKRTRAAMKKAGGVADEEESVDENVMIEADEIVSDADSAAQPEVQETAENKPAKKKENSSPARSSLTQSSSAKPNNAARKRLRHVRMQIRSSGWRKKARALWRTRRCARHLSAVARTCTKSP